MGGVEKTDTAGLQCSLASIPCGGGPETPAAFDTTGGTSLRYVGNRFMQNWKTPTTPGVCYVVRMTTTADGQSLSALFTMQ